MNWYYVEQGQQAGPVDDAQLEQLRASGRIQPETLVWHDALPNWQPYSQAKSESATPAPGLRIAPPVAGTSTAGAQARCTECGGTFPVENMIRYGAAHVCANCKPAFVQKLAEGAQINVSDLRFAGFWTRFAAVFLDGLILWVVSFTLQMAFGLTAAQALGRGSPATMVVQFFLIGIQMIIAIGYETFFIGKYGATLGKMACKIKVVTADGGKVSYMLAFGRYFGKVLSSLTCLIGYIMAAFDDEKRALHDRICNTRVVFK